jgi:hypothetical protein
VPKGPDSLIPLDAPLGILAKALFAGVLSLGKGLGAAVPEINPEEPINGAQAIEISMRFSASSSPRCETRRRDSTLTFQPQEQPRSQNCSLSLRTKRTRGCWLAGRRRPDVWASERPAVNAPEPPEPHHYVGEIAHVAHGAAGRQWPVADREHDTSPRHQGHAKMHSSESAATRDGRSVSAARPDDPWPLRNDQSPCP